MQDSVDATKHKKLGTVRAFLVGIFFEKSKFKRFLSIIRYNDNVALLQRRIYEKYD